MNALMRTDVNFLALDPDDIRTAAQRRRSRKAAEAADAAGGKGKVPFWQRLRQGGAPPKDPSVSPEKLTPLTPAGYIKARIDDQVGWYQENAARLSRNLRRLQLLGLLFGGLGTLLAAIHLQIYVAVTTAIVAAYATYRATWQIETSLTLYNSGDEPQCDPALVVRAHADGTGTPGQRRQARRHRRGRHEGRAHRLGPGDGGT